jgi:hypothetical protein
LVELLWLGPVKKDGAQTAFTKSTGFAIIISVHTMSAQQPEFKEKKENSIPDDPDETELIQDVCSSPIDQER